MYLVDYYTQVNTLDHSQSVKMVIPVYTLPDTF